MWAPLLEAIPRVAKEINPRGLSNIMHTLGVLLKLSESYLHQHIIDALLAAVLRAALHMKPEALSNAM
jgi:hypothetical protein